MLVNPLNKSKGLMGEMLNGGMAEYCLVSADQTISQMHSNRTARPRHEAAQFATP